jgi:hypothetical protein
VGTFVGVQSRVTMIVRRRVTSRYSLAARFLARFVGQESRSRLYHGFGKIVAQRFTRVGGRRMGVSSQGSWWFPALRRFRRPAS